MGNVRGTPGGQLSVGTGTARPGEIARCEIPVGRDICGHGMSIPIVLVNGAENGPVLWINGGTHGDEPEGAIAIVKLLDRLDPGAICGGLVLCPAMNPEAFRAGSRGDPSDPAAYDMNRIYPGRGDGTPTERTAAAHFAAMQADCDLQINVHSGGTNLVMGELLFAPETPMSLELAAAMGPTCSLIVPIGVDEGNPASQIAAVGGAGIGVERGGLAGSFGDDAHAAGEALCGGIVNVLRHYRMVNGTPAYAERWWLGALRTIRAPASGVWLAAPELPLLEQLREGVPLGTVYDLHGEVLAMVRMPCHGIVAGLRARPQTTEGERLAFFVEVTDVRDDLLP